MSPSPSPTHRCTTCKSASEKPRNLVVFIDGTSNKPDDKNTNVWKLFNQVKASSSIPDAEPEQCAEYWPGIGTHPEHLAPAYSRLEMAFAWNVEKNVKLAYAWLAKNYKEGSQIYLFGFSRGAYQVRVLASMIHEVGLTKSDASEHIDWAYDRYLSINPYKPNTREEAQAFKKKSCWPGVRVHFVGVWDTVSSIGFVKKDVFVSASANVINSCHFRHALALDERRVKFMPEYFHEINAHRNIRTTSAVSDVKEVWFAGSHSDVGGINRTPANSDNSHVRRLAGSNVDIVGLNHLDPERVIQPHAGNAPLLWMRQEATTQGLVFDPEISLWSPDDIDLGRKDTMKGFYRFMEILPIRHQVSFSGSGKHERRWHLSRPRRVIPGQHIHASVFAGDIYAPCATLGDGIDIPIVPRRASGTLRRTELSDQQAMIDLTSVLNDQQKTLESLEKVIFLLDSWLDNGQAPAIHPPEWPETFFHGKFSLAVIYYVASNSSSDAPGHARDSLRVILSSAENTECRAALFALRLLSRHETLRGRIIDRDTIKAIVGALEWTAQRPNEILFPLVMDSLHYLSQDGNLRDDVISELSVNSGGKTRLSLALEVKAPRHLMASLNMVVSLAKYRSGPFEQLKPKIIELAVKRRGPVGSAAVEALVALKVPLAPNIRFSNILGYLHNILPRLDIEGGSSSSPDSSGDLPMPAVLQNSSGELDNEIMRKLVSTIESRNARERTAATLALLKLCGNPTIRKYLSDHNFVDVLMRQLEQKKTSLLASYALKTCLAHNMKVDFPRAGRLIFIMFNNGWFDDSIGRVEGFKIFRELIMSGQGKLEQELVGLKIIKALVKKLEGGDHNEVRVSLICFDCLGSASLDSLVKENINCLKDEREAIQKKGVKVLSALAQTVAGQDAIKLHLTEIMDMFPPFSTRPRSQLFGPTAALYGLSKNETLRELIRSSEKFATIKGHRPLPSGQLAVPK